MANDVFFRLPFAKVEEMEKTFRDNGISDADALSFRGRLDSPPPPAMDSEIHLLQDFAIEFSQVQMRSWGPVSW